MKNIYVVLSLIDGEWGLDHQGSKDFFLANSPEDAIKQCKQYQKIHGLGPDGDREEFKAFLKDSEEFEHFVKTNNMIQ